MPSLEKKNKQKKKNMKIKLGNDGFLNVNIFFLAYAMLCHSMYGVGTEK